MMLLPLFITGEILVVEVARIQLTVVGVTPITSKWGWAATATSQIYDTPSVIIGWRDAYSSPLTCICIFLIHGAGHY